jgi:hypothetical protein
MDKSPDFMKFGEDDRGAVAVFITPLPNPSLFAMARQWALVASTRVAIRENFVYHERRLNLRFQRSVAIILSLSDIESRLTKVSAESFSVGT